MQFIAANKRDKVLLLMIGSLFFAAFMLITVTISTRNENYSTYQLVRNDFHWTTSFLAFGLFALFEAFLTYDLMANTFLNHFPLYFCCFTMRYWLQQIW